MHNIKYHIDNRGVATITLDRPDRHNAFDDVMIEELTDAFSLADSNDDVRVLVLDAKGKSFCAGADVNWMKKMASYSVEENKADADKLAGMLNTLYLFRKPTIAKVQGAAYGGAVGLIACCDIAIGSRLSKFCLSEVKLGLVPATISPYVIQAMGLREAKRLFITAEVISSRRARRLGLLHESVSESDIDEVVEGILAQTIKNGPAAVTKAKQLAINITGKEINQQLIDETSHCIADIRVSREGQEGLGAFLEKRAPAWVREDV